MVDSLREICQETIIKFLEIKNFNGKLIKDLCKFVPDELLEPIFVKLLEKGSMTDAALLAFLGPSRIALSINQATIRNSLLRQIGLNCPNLITLDLSNCSKVNNSVVRTILQGCYRLENLTLNRCVRVTDSAFDISDSPFQLLTSCFTLRTISMQGCSQITGEIIRLMNKNCRNLQCLNLSQCKGVKSSKIQQVFEHNQLQSLNLAFIDDISDEAFMLLPKSSYSINIIDPNNSSIVSLNNNNINIINNDDTSNINDTTSNINSFDSSNPMEISQELKLIKLQQQDNINNKRRKIYNSSSSSLLRLFLGKSRITDMSIFNMTTYVTQLIEIHLQWCIGITDNGITVLVQNCPKLQVVDLKSCAITDISLESISKYCNNLLSLDLSWCLGFTNHGLQLLVDSYKNILMSHKNVDNNESESDNEYANNNNNNNKCICNDNNNSNSSGSSSNSGSNSNNRNKVGVKNLSLIWCTQLTTKDIINVCMHIQTLEVLELSKYPKVDQEVVDTCKQCEIDLIEQ